MGLVEDFIQRYRREFDFFDQAARIVAQSLQLRLDAAGIRAMVTFRAKSTTRLEAKIRQRARSNAYASLNEIYADIVDLAGVRVALYFPGERQRVDAVVRELFHLVDPPKEFPSASKPSYEKRFSGYWAVHYRVQLKESTLNDAQKRYADARVEIQVASVLMHAWAEVEHDLVYKPLQGRLSDGEYAILDELNGLVIAGEIALERLQRAGESRVAAVSRPFSNHYDLAAYLVDKAKSLLKEPFHDAALGRADVLFDLLSRLDLATPGRLEPFLSSLHGETESRPLAEQIIDQLLAEDSSRYQIYTDLRVEREIMSSGYTPFGSDTVLHTIGHFVHSWANLEQEIRRRVRLLDAQRALFPTFRLLPESGLFSRETLAELEQLRRLRNNLVHGEDIPALDEIVDAAERLKSILANLNSTSAAAPNERLQTDAKKRGSA